MTLRSLHQCYKIPVKNLAAIDIQACAKKRRDFMKRWDARKYLPEYNPALREKLGIKKEH